MRSSTGNFLTTGNLGDSFGALNALFSGLAFAAVAAALLLQRLDVDATLKQLREQVKLAQRARAESTEAVARFYYAKDIIEARTEAEVTRGKWFSGPSTRYAFAAHWVDEDLGQSRPEKEQTEETWPTSRLIEYYAALYHHLDTLSDERTEEAEDDEKTEAATESEKEREQRFYREIPLGILARLSPIWAGSEDRGPVQRAHRSA